MPFVTELKLSNTGMWPFRTWKMCALDETGKKIKKVKKYNNAGNAAKAQDFARKLAKKGYKLKPEQIDEIEKRMLINVRKALDDIFQQVVD